ncbi:hypothetical protein [Hoeflea sp. TYP-13]|uniref:hypothetical protein n=1 Tax=Hoeflea sp. TYP-13 TaxID=3230023 RepID=UPI0034C6580F
MFSFTINRRLADFALGYVFQHAVPAMQLVIIATSFGWLASGNLLWFAVGAVCTILTFVPAMCISDAAIRAATDLCVSALVFAHVFFGMHVGLYETSVVYDKLIHALGCGAIAVIVIAFVSRYCSHRRIDLPVPFLFLFVTGIVVSLGTLWEVFEFAVDRTGLFQSQKGLSDTMLDLMADVLGAGVATGLIIAGMCRNYFPHALQAHLRRLPYHGPKHSIGENDA